MAVDKLVDSAQLNAELTSVADAIRTKGGTSAALAFPAGFVSAVEAIETGGGGEYTEEKYNALVSGNLSGNLIVTAQSIGRAFADTMGDFTLSFPNATTVRSFYAFENSTVRSIYMPMVTSIPGRAAKGSAISGAKNITIFFAKSATAGTYSLSDCSSIKIVVIKSFGNNYYQFRSDNSLQIVDVLISDGKIDNSWNSGCAAFNTLILRGGTVVTLSNTTAFNTTMFASGNSGGTLYVPSALISSYQSATNWSTILGYANNQILPIEGSQYENYYADGTPIT